MGISDRINGWVDDRRTAWGGALGEFILGTIAKGATKTLVDLEPGVIDQVSETVRKVIDNPDIPLETKRMLEKSLEQGDILAVGMGWLLSIIGLIPAMFGLGGPIGNILNHAQELALRSALLDPETAIRIWRRDPEKYAQFLEDLKYGGWTDERIEALKFATLFYPAPADLVRWQAREVFEPAMVEKYGLDDEFGGIDLEPFRKAGMTDEQSLNYWRAHWEHASWNQVVEMLRRGLITEADVWDWFRLVEIPPYWRDKLIGVSWEVPTRVDVRRFWDMRTIDEARLREIYTAQGYHGKDLDDYVLWTKVYTAFPELLARYKNGWITLDDVRRELVSLGMMPERADTMIEEKIKKAAPERTVTEKDITKTDIIKGVKTDVITRVQGVELLQEIGYDRDEAVYILDINIPTDQEDVVVEDRKISKADILKGLKAKVITRDDARTRLMELRYSSSNAELLLKIYDAQVAPPVDVKLKEASKADIVLGVTKGLIDQSEGYAMLLDLDFAPEAASFILFVKTEESPFSPISYNEFKDLTQKYRQAAGMEVTTMPEELKKAAEEVVRLTGEVEALEKSITEEKRGLIEGEVLPEATTRRLKKLQVAKNRAISELERVKSEYNSRLAEWRHGA